MIGNAILNPVVECIFAVYREVVFESAPVRSNCWNTEFCSFKIDKSRQFIESRMTVETCILIGTYKKIYSEPTRKVSDIKRAFFS